MDFNKLVIPVAVGVVVYLAAKKFGLLPSAEKIAVKQSAKLPAGQNVFDRNFKIPKGSLILTPASAEKVARNLHSAFGLFNDNEDKVYGIFRSLTTQAQVTSLSIVFYKLYGKDLFYYMTSRLSSKEMANVLSIINNKPKYRLK